MKTPKQTIYGDRAFCYNCYRPKSSCMCRYITPIETNTKVVILMHPKEFKKVKNNTGRFTHLSLKNSELFVGVDFSNHKRINEILSEYESYILYPSKDAIDIAKEQLHPKKKLALFLIDATWSCAKSIFCSSTNLQTLPHISFSTQKTSEYQIKLQPQSNFLSTIETMQVVLELLAKQGLEDVPKERLENFLVPFYKMIAYQKELIQNPKSNAVRFKKRR